MVTKLRKKGYFKMKTSLALVLGITYCSASSSQPTSDSSFLPRDDNVAGWQEDLPDEWRERRAQPYPPPPPPPPQQQQQQSSPLQRSVPPFTARTPIHYNFRSKVSSNDEPTNFVDSEDNSNESREERIPEFASARRDPVTQFQSTFRGRVLLFISASSTGALLSAFLLNGWWHPGVLAFSIGYLLRGAFGDCVRSLALALLWTMQRSRMVWKEHPTWRHVKACVRAGPRRPYPPARNPWNYQPPPNYPTFNMMYTVISIALVGSTVGGNVPLVPKWLGGLLGAGCFAYLATLPSALGDLVRTAGMRVVGLLQELWQVAIELRLRQQLTVFAIRLIDRAMFLDRQHRIRDRVTAGATLFYQQVIVRAMNQQQGTNTDDEPRSQRDRSRRRMPNDDMDDSGRRIPSPRRRPSRERGDDRWREDESNETFDESRRDGRRLENSESQRDRERMWANGRGRDSKDDALDRDFTRRRRPEWQEDEDVERRNPDPRERRRPEHKSQYYE